MAGYEVTDRAKSSELGFKYLGRRQPLDMQVVELNGPSARLYPRGLATSWKSSSLSKVSNIRA